jgi:hypothetical protein
MKDTVANNVPSLSGFKTSLVISEILITALVLIGFYIIFNRFNKKNNAFRQKR